MGIGYFRPALSSAAAVSILLNAVITKQSFAGWEPGEPFSNFKIYAYNEAECGSYDLPSFDSGPHRFSCRAIEIAHISLREEPERRFEARACARGRTKEEAAFNARVQSERLVNDLKIKDAKSRFSSGDPMYYVTDKFISHCVDTTEIGSLTGPQ